MEILGYLDYDIAWELGKTPHYVDVDKEEEGKRTRTVDKEHLREYVPRNILE